MDIVNTGVLWNHIIQNIEANAEKRALSGVKFDTDGDVILCDDERAAEIIADFLEKIGFDVAKTSVYDEECGNTWYCIDVE